MHCISNFFSFSSEDFYVNMTAVAEEESDLTFSDVDADQLAKSLAVSAPLLTLTMVLSLSNLNMTQKLQLK